MVTASLDGTIAVCGGSSKASTSAAAKGVLQRLQVRNRIDMWRGFYRYPLLFEQSTGSRKVYGNGGFEADRRRFLLTQHLDSGGCVVNKLRHAREVKPPPLTPSR